MANHSSTELITLGTAAGPAIRGKENGMASAVVVDDQFYMIDFGLGCVRSAHEAGLRGKDFKAGFITHLHSDHVAELPGFLMWNWGAPVQGFSHEIPIHGPGKDTEHPEGATLSGTQGLIEHTLEAFSYDLNIRVTDEARPVMSDLIRPVEITVPALTPDPFLVYEDDHVKVTAVLVDHPPVHPAFGFRFDTAAGSITFSGDTAESDALAQLALDTDILVHEAVNIEFFAARGFDAAFLNHQQQSHSTPEGAGRIATASGAKRLVLSHLAGVATPEQWAAGAASTYAGPIDVATSGQRFTVVPDTAYVTV